MRPKYGSPTAKAVRVASGQHGVLTVAQLLDAGFSRDRVKRWHAKGLLHREYRGVYRLGHRARSAEAHYLAAVLACGPGALLCGFAAAHHLGLTRGGRPGSEVLTPHHRRVRGVIVHRARRIDAADRTRWNGIPVTAPARTCLDLAGRLSLEDLGRLCHQAEVLHHLRPPAVDAALARRPNTPGAEKLLAIFHGDAPILLSRLEKHFRRFLRAHDLPPAKTNRPEGAHYVDCRWSGRALTVELDSYAFHHSRHAWEQDRLRERAARARGDEFRRYTWRDVVEEPDQMLAELRALLPPLGCAAAAR